MAKIRVLDEYTVNKIAAGEVVEKPLAVVKELVENSIDAGSSQITVEIKNGGIDFIRITDNGSGISKEEIGNAFERHATSKITAIDDLNTLTSLGFRGEALASISAVSKVECITKTSDSLTGINYVIEGGKEHGIKEIGCPQGTTFVVRDLFYNVPARRKFLKTPATEGGYINELMEKLSMSHPDISFKYINNGQLKLQTKGNNSLKDVIYSIYGRDITSNILEINLEDDIMNITGFIGRPGVSRGTRNHISCFINGRYIKNNILYKAIEEGYNGYKMINRFPFAVLNINIDSSLMDVNVHPSKMEVRFSEPDRIFSLLCNSIRNTLRESDIIPEIKIAEKNDTVSGSKGSGSIPFIKKEIKTPEPFETRRIENLKKEEDTADVAHVKENEVKYNTKKNTPVQDTLFDISGMKHEERKNYNVIGCVFSTYWIIEYHDEMYIMDQHAAHEKVLFEQFMKKIKLGSIASQILSPQIIITLSAAEAEVINSHYEDFVNTGFDISHFGGNEYAVSAVPAEIPGISSEQVLLDLFGILSSDKNISRSETSFAEKIASMSCKAAVKGGRHISEREAYELVNSLFELDNPFCCPHGRPTMIKMTRNELEKQFGRIV